MHYSRGYKMGEELRAAGFSQNQVEEMATDAIGRAQRIEPLAPPPPEVVVLNRYGDEEGEPLTVTEAANKLTDWRARHAEAQQQELQELVGAAEQERSGSTASTASTTADRTTTTAATDPTAATAGDDACANRASTNRCRTPA